MPSSQTVAVSTLRRAGATDLVARLLAMATPPGAVSRQLRADYPGHTYRVYQRVYSEGERMLYRARDWDRLSDTDWAWPPGALTATAVRGATRVLYTVVLQHLNPQLGGVIIATVSASQPLQVQQLVAATAVMLETAGRPAGPDWTPQWQSNTIAGPGQIASVAIESVGGIAGGIASWAPPPIDPQFFPVAPGVRGKLIRTSYGEVWRVVGPLYARRVR